MEHPSVHARGGVRLRDLLVLVMITGILGSVWIAHNARARREQQKAGCEAHLKQLGVLIYMWAHRFTSSAGTYPSSTYPDYKRAVGREALDALRTYPTRDSSLTRGDDSLFVCPVRGTEPDPRALDYRAPSPSFPGGYPQIISDPSWPVFCDRPTNHDPDGQDDMNILLISGEVIRARCGSPEWNTAMQYTQDP